MGEHVAARRREPVTDPVGELAAAAMLRPEAGARAGTAGAEPKAVSSWLCVPIQESRSTSVGIPGTSAAAVIPQIRQAAIGGFTSPHASIQGSAVSAAVGTLPRNALYVHRLVWGASLSSSHHQANQRRRRESPRHLEVGPHRAVFPEAPEVRRGRREWEFGWINT